MRFLFLIFAILSFFDLKSQSTIVLSFHKLKFETDWVQEGCYLERESYIPKYPKEGIKFSLGTYKLEIGKAINDSIFLIKNASREDVKNNFGFYFVKHHLATPIPTVVLFGLKSDSNELNCIIFETQISLQEAMLSLEAAKVYYTLLNGNYQLDMANYHKLMKKYLN